ncbi:hypothetical protein [Streptomyces sp. NPDC101145]|uniref:hypothetical protein n=1 Tax=Streptomyces sp. NPDC101145 TaxID=3366112 RepID=UPI00381F1379
MPRSISPAVQAAVAYAAFTAAHEVADFWVQRDVDAVAKGKPGREGATACARHVASYAATQALAVAAANRCLGLGLDWRRAAAGLAVSAITHYLADRSAGHWPTNTADTPLVARLAHRAGKTQWLARDPGAPMHMDQAWHKGWIAVAAVICASRP